MGFPPYCVCATTTAGGPCPICDGRTTTNVATSEGDGWIIRPAAKADTTEPVREPSALSTRPNRRARRAAKAIARRMVKLAKKARQIFKR